MNVSPLVRGEVIMPYPIRGNTGGKLIGKDGVTFTPSVSDDGILSWENDGGLPNPDPVNLKGRPGNDYVLTEEDKKEIVTNVISELPVYNGEVIIE